MTRIALALLALAACDPKAADDTSAPADTDATAEDTPPAVDPVAGSWSGECTGHVSATYGTPDDPGYYEADVLLEPVLLDLVVDAGAVTGTLEGTQVFTDGYAAMAFSADVAGDVAGADLTVATLPTGEEYEPATLTLALVLSGDRLTGTLANSTADGLLDCTFDRS